MIRARAIPRATCAQCLSSRPVWRFFDRATRSALCHRCRAPKPEPKAGAPRVFEEPVSETRLRVVESHPDDPAPENDDLDGELPEERERVDPEREFRCMVWRAYERESGPEDARRSEKEYWGHVVDDDEIASWVDDVFERLSSGKRLREALRLANRAEERGGLTSRGTSPRGDAPHASKEGPDPAGTAQSRSSSEDTSRTNGPPSDHGDIHACLDARFAINGHRQDVATASAGRGSEEPAPNHPRRDEATGCRKAKYVTREGTSPNPDVTAGETALDLERKAAALRAVAEDVSWIS